MKEKHISILKIDMQFKNLICPLSKKEYLQLEENILSDGCRDPIITWNGIIVDGHNRYEICTRHLIPFYVEPIEFDCRESAIAWICANQLGRRNITDETRKFLIGKQYESEKIVSRIRNPKGHNQHNAKDDSSRYIPNDTADEAESNYRHITSGRIADENHVSRGTVEKYAIYSRAVDAIAKKEPAIVPKILSGQYKISHKHLVELSKLSPEDIQKVERRIEKLKRPYVQYNKTRREIQFTSEQAVCPERTPAVTVKDMPAFDPDAEITGLTLTIPSWAGSIERAREKSDFTIISSDAREKLIAALESLSLRVEEMLSAMEEE